MVTGKRCHIQKVENLKAILMKLASSDPSILLNMKFIEQKLSKLPLSHIPDHPTYAAIILKAISELNKDGGSSEEAISKFIEAKYEDLPLAHTSLLSHHLEKLVADKVVLRASKNCYMLPVEGAKSYAKLKQERKHYRRLSKGRRVSRQQKVEERGQLRQEQNSVTGVGKEPICEEQSTELEPRYELEDLCPLKKWKQVIKQKKQVIKQKKEANGGQSHLGEWQTEVIREQSQACRKQVERSCDQAQEKTIAYEKETEMTERKQTSGKRSKGIEEQTEVEVRKIRAIKAQGQVKFTREHDEVEEVHVEITKERNEIQENAVNEEQDQPQEQQNHQQNELDVLPFRVPSGPFKMIVGEQNQVEERDQVADIVFLGQLENGVTQGHHHSEEHKSEETERKSQPEMKEQGQVDFSVKQEEVKNAHVEVTGERNGTEQKNGVNEVQDRCQEKHNHQQNESDVLPVQVPSGPTKVIVGEQNRAEKTDEVAGVVFLEQLEDEMTQELHHSEEQKTEEIEGKNQPEMEGPVELNRKHLEVKEAAVVEVAGKRNEAEQENEVNKEQGQSQEGQDCQQIEFDLLQVEVPRKPVEVIVRMQKQGEESSKVTKVLFLGEQVGDMTQELHHTKEQKSQQIEGENQPEEEQIEDIRTQVKLQEKNIQTIDEHDERKGKEVEASKEQERLREQQNNTYHEIIDLSNMLKLFTHKLEGDGALGTTCSSFLASQKADHFASLLLSKQNQQIKLPNLKRPLEVETTTSKESSEAKKQAKLFDQQDASRSWSNSLFISSDVGYSLLDKSMNIKCQRGEAIESKQLISQRAEITTSFNSPLYSQQVVVDLQAPEHSKQLNPAVVREECVQNQHMQEQVEPQDQGLFRSEVVIENTLAKQFPLLDQLERQEQSQPQSQCGALKSKSDMGLAVVVPFPKHQDQHAQQRLQPRGRGRPRKQKLNRATSMKQALLSDHEKTNNQQPRRPARGRPPKFKLATETCGDA